MPLSKYFGGKGAKVMNSMKDKYGDKKGEQVFYATANKQKKHPIAPSDELRKKYSKRR